jgi:hypothetical protein
MPSLRTGPISRVARNVDCSCKRRGDYGPKHDASESRKQGTQSESRERSMSQGARASRGEEDSQSSTYRESMANKSNSLDALVKTGRQRKRLRAKQNATSARLLDGASARDKRKTR